MGYAQDLRRKSREVAVSYQSMDYQPLFWESSYEIILELMQRYPNVDLDGLGLDQLNTMIVELPNFSDDPQLVNDMILTEILRDWYEERFISNGS